MAEKIKEETRTEKESALSTPISSKSLRMILVVIVGLAIIIGAFTLGVFVGYRKANFSYAWADNYNRNFGGPQRGGMMGFFNDDGFISGHGISGSVLKINNNLMTLKNDKNIETPVLISDSTIIMEQRGMMISANIKVGDEVTVVGSPNSQGQIEAQFIRVFPSGQQLQPSPTDGKPFIPMMFFR